MTPIKEFLEKALFIASFLGYLVIMFLVGTMIASFILTNI